LNFCGDKHATSEETMKTLIKVMKQSKKLRKIDLKFKR